MKQEDSPNDHADTGEIAMRGWMLRLGLSLIVAIGIRSGPLSAQVPNGPPPPGSPFYAPLQPGILVVPAVPYEPAYHPPFGMGIAPRDQPPPSPSHLIRSLNVHGLGCEANRWGACSSFNYEFRFIFGSCRDFFHDTCIPGQPCFSRQNPR